MTQLGISRLSKAFTDRQTGREIAVISDMDLEIGTGEFVSLLGPSGCGKTTTLRCIAGFESPDSGTIRFDGQDILALPPEKRDIGLVFQNYALFPHMTVAENVGFGLEMRKVAGAEARRRISEVLEMVQLAELSERYPRQLSGGQQQRVALARALVIEPKLLLLDEPLANLDAKLREDMRFFIRNLQKRVGITAVYVTHDQSEAMVMSDRVVVMFEGCVQQNGAPDEIYNRPASRRVAGFVGLSNFVQGQVVSMQGGGGCVLDTPLGLLHSECTLAEGECATIVLRPECLVLSREQPAKARNSIVGTIRERNYLGHTMDYRVECPGGLMLQVHERALLNAELGDVVHCSFPPERAWLMAESGAGT